MNYVKKQELKRQYKVEIFKGVKIIDNEHYDFIESRQFFLTLDEAKTYREKLKPTLEETWIIRCYKKTAEEWILIEITD